MAECIKSLKAGSLCVIGRLTSSDVIITHKSISGKHCTIQTQKSEKEVVDLTDGSDGINNSLQCTIVDHSSNGTWVLSSKDPTKPFRLIKRRKTNIVVGDIIMLLSPSHPESAQCRYVLEKGINEEELVLCKALLLPHRTLSKRANIGGDCEISCKILKKSKDFEEQTENSKELILVGIDNKPIPVTSTGTAAEPVTDDHGSYYSACTSRVPVASVHRLPVSTASVLPVEAVPPFSLTLSPVSDAPTLARELSQEECPKCFHSFTVVELVSHVNECNPSLLPTEDKEEEKDKCCYCLNLFPISKLFAHACSCPAMLEKVAVPPTTLSLSPVYDAPTLARELSQEECPKCFHSFNVVELVSHINECNPSLLPTEDKEEEKDKCCYCLNLFPISKLVAHACSCPAMLEKVAVPPATLSLSPVSDAPTLARELSQEECPKCFHSFNVVELVSHINECNASLLPTEDKEEEKDKCCYCLNLFPISKLVAHVYSCPAMLEKVAGSTSIITSAPDIRAPAPLTTDSTATRSLSSTGIPLAATPASSSSSVVPSLFREVSKEQCPKCSCLFDVIELIPHVSGCKPPPLSSLIEEEDHCQHCLKLFPISKLVPHASSCSERRFSTASSSSTAAKVYADDTDTCTDGSDPLERCMLCFCDFPLSKLVLHAQNCEGEMLGSKERFKEFLPSAHEVDVLAVSVLTPTQQRAVDYVRQSSKAEADHRYSDLCMRVIRLGYSPKDLQRVLQWVRHDAPIIIHVNLDSVLHYLVKDTHYRNLFETRASGGSSDYTARRGWEDNIFNKIYHSSPPDERVKYGVLNIVGDPSGVRCCYSYGDSFLQLKKVRLRTTFASMDTSSSTVKLSCCEHYGNVLNEYSDPELKAILDVATRKKPYLKSIMITHYKEVQIHGPVCLSENVDCIVANARHRGNHEMENLLDTFVRRNGCNLIWMDKDTDYGIGTGLGTGMWLGFGSELGPGTGPGFGLSEYDSEY